MQLLYELILIFNEIICWISDQIPRAHTVQFIQGSVSLGKHFRVTQILDMCNYFHQIETHLS